MNEKELKQLLLKQNKEFKKIFDEHRLYEKQLKRLAAKSFLTEKEKLKEKKLKKKKLVCKDRMYYIMTEYRKSLR